jgi:hypothetical protein
VTDHAWPATAWADDDARGFTLIAGVLWDVIKILITH